MNHPIHLFRASDSQEPTTSWVDDAFPQHTKLPTAGFVRRRAKLNELDGYFHCSIIGTCLSTADLRKLVPKHSDLDRNRASDLDIHHMAVKLSGDGTGAGCKALNKLLDTIYSGDLKRFQRYRSEDELQAAWNECLKHGDVPGAYWALMTHPSVSAYLRQLAFGEVHMLSHLVGAANRADVRRLLALEGENAKLKDKAERQQHRLQELSIERIALERRMSSHAGISHDRRIEELEAQAQSLEAALQAREQTIAHYEGRCRRLEEQLQDVEQSRRALKETLAEVRHRSDEMRVELNSLDKHLTDTLKVEGGDGVPADVLRNKRIVYVGGRPHATQAIYAMVKAAGGELVIHDGGIEDRRGLLAGSLPGADLVVFPVDCVAHNSVTLLKRTCERHGVPYRALRSSGLTSFTALVAEMSLPSAQSGGCAPISRMCLHHG